MEITEVKVFPVNEEKLKAFVSIVFDRCFMINDIKIIQGRDGLFVSMPSRRKKSGEFKDVAHPLNNETRRMIETAIVGEYERVLAERGEDLPAPPRPYPTGDDPADAGAGEAATGAGSPAEGADSRNVDPRSVDPRPAAPPPPGFGLPAQAAVPAAAEAAAEPAPEPDAAEGADKSLEEVQEIHLRDSFWSVS